jgi:biotin synthase
MSDLSKILERVYKTKGSSRRDLEFLLSLTDQKQIQQIFSFADRVRKEQLGDGVHLRGIVEFSNYCRKPCAYCGLNKNNASLQRYRLTDEEILKAIKDIYRNRIRTVVLQSGEDDAIDPDWLEQLIRTIKKEFPDLAITLSVGEWPKKDYQRWRKAGADRYLLKIETTDERLYRKLHFGESSRNRRRCIRDLEKLGYQTGSGCMIGLPGQTVKTIAGDIRFFAKHDFDMIGIGPFIPHQATPLKDGNRGNVQLTLLAVALTRIVTRNSHLPGTTSLGSMDKDYRNDALQAGGNILMPNFTPLPYKKYYEIYPGKRCITEAAGACAGCMDSMVKKIGRYVDYGRGDSLK